MPAERAQGRCARRLCRPEKGGDGKLGRAPPAVLVDAQHGAQQLELAARVPVDLLVSEHQQPPAVAKRHLDVLDHKAQGAALLEAAQHRLALAQLGEQLRDAVGARHAPARQVDAVAGQHLAQLLFGVHIANPVEAAAVGGCQWLLICDCCVIRLGWFSRRVCCTRQLLFSAGRCAPRCGAAAQRPCHVQQRVGGLGSHGSVERLVDQGQHVVLSHVGAHLLGRHPVFHGRIHGGWLAACHSRWQQPRPSACCVRREGRKCFNFVIHIWVVAGGGAPVRHTVMPPPHPRAHQPPPRSTVPQDPRKTQVTKI